MIKRLGDRLDNLTLKFYVRGQFLKFLTNGA